MIRKSFRALVLLSFCGVVSAQTPTIAAGGVVNDATFDSRLCPGALAAIFGSNFGSSKTGLTVTVGGKQAFVVNVAASQLAVEIPFEVAPGPAAVVVQTAAGSSAPANVTLSAYAPALLSQDGSGKGLGHFVDLNGNAITAAAGASPNQNLVTIAIGLGQTNPASATGVAPTGSAPTTATATLTVNGEQAKVPYAGAAPGAVGVYQVNFTVPNDLATGNYPVVLSIGGQTGNTVMLPVAGAAPATTNPTITSLDNGASFTPKSTAAPGALLTLKGTNFGSTDNLGVYPATSASGVSVTISGAAVPIFDLIGSENQINLLAPSELPSSGTVPVQVTAANGSSSFFTLTMAAAVPAMFALTDPSKSTRRNAIAMDTSAGWIAMPVSMSEAIGKSLGLAVDCTSPSPAVYCGKPASAGDMLTLYATGLGIATPGGDPAGPPLATGQVAPADGSVIYNTVAAPVVTIGGAAATVSTSAVAPGMAGIYQINVQIPSSAPSGDDVPVTLTVAGASTDTATIAIQ